MPSLLTDGGWQNCRAWPSVKGSVCSHNGMVRTLVNDTVTEFKLPDIDSDGSEDYAIVAVRLEADGVFVASLVDNDLYVSRFDATGRFAWRRRLLTWSRGRHLDERTRPSVFQVLDGKFFFLNNRCQGFAFDREGRDLPMAIPFGLAFSSLSEGSVKCASPSVRGDELVFHSTVHGLLHTAHNQAATWIEVPRFMGRNAGHYNTFSSKFRLRRMSEGWFADGMIKIDTFDERSFSLTLPTGCLQGDFENLTMCAADLENVPWLTKESKEFIFYQYPESLAQRVERSHDGRTIFMNEKFVEIPEGNEIFSAQNGILFQTPDGPLQFLRVGSSGETERKNVSNPASVWRDFVDSDLELEKAALGRTAIVCGRGAKFNECIAWTQDGLLGDDGVLGSSFDAETAKMKLIRFVFVAGWEGISAAVETEQGISIGNFVYNDQGRLRLVERVTATGVPAHFQELLHGNLMAVGDTVLSRVSDGVWEVTPQKQPRKRSKMRTMPDGSDLGQISDANPLTSHFQNAFEPASESEALNTHIFVLPHFAYD